MTKPFLIKKCDDTNEGRADEYYASDDEVQSHSEDRWN